MDRRDFLLGAGALAASSFSGHDTFAAEAEVSGLSILQGLTTETTTQLTVDVDKKAVVFYSLTDKATNRLVEPASVRPVIRDGSGTRVDKIKFSDLELGHEYKLQVKDKKNKILDERFLKTVDLNKKGARIGIMSCMNDMFGDKKNSWKAAQATDVDYLFFIGDSVYGDLLILHGPGYLWSRYIETRKNVPFYRWKNLKPVIAIWDDHDFGKNNKGGDYKHKDYAYHYFQAFFAQEPTEGDQTYLQGYANSKYFQAFGQNFVFFDGRYYRGLTNTAGQKGFFGIEQIDWMSQVVYDRPKPTLILSGSPFFGRLEKTASYEVNAPEEMEYFFNKVSTWRAPALFVGGDLHYSEVSSVDRSAVGYDTVEIISSCMHSTKKSKYYDNPNPHRHGYLKENFIVLEQSLDGDPVWKMECIAAAGKVAFSDIIEIG